MDIDVLNHTLAHMHYTSCDILLLQQPTSLVTTTSQAPRPHPSRASVMVIGSAAIDVTAKQSSSKDILSATTARGSVSFTPGGVGRNIAEAASKLLMVQNSNETTGQPVVLVSAVGATTMMKPKATTMCEDEQERDSFGRILFDDMVRTGMRTDGLIHRSSSSDEDNANDQQQSTAVCNLVLDAQGVLSPESPIWASQRPLR